MILILRFNDLSMSLQREEYIKKKRKKKLIKISLFFLVLIILFSLTVYISHLHQIRISKVELSGGILVTQSDVEKETLSFMYGSYYWMFPKNNSFIYPHNDLEKYLKEKFKRIDTINIRLKNLQTISVEITERKPQAMWCDGLPSGEMSTSTQASLPEHCYFMDDNSTIFVEAPYFSGDAYFKYYGLVSTSSPVIGAEYIASSTEFRDLSEFVSNIKQMSADPIYLLAKDNGEFTLVLSSGAKIYFDTKEPLSKTSANLGALLHSGTFSTTSDPTLSVDYIDLRFGNKLFYKLK
jgi:hypothetical protein